MVRERDPDVAACSDADALGAADFRLSLIERAVASQWAQCALEATGLAEEGLAWTDVLNLLDACDAAWLARGAQGRLGQSLQVACLAAVSILAKHETSCTSEQGRLHRLDFLPELTSQMVRSQARAFLNLLQWRTGVPSLEAWISAFFKRVELLNTGSLAVQINSAQQFAINLAQGILISSAACPRHQPCQVARALVALCLAQMGVVDSHRLRPQDVCEDEWDDLHLQALTAPPRQPATQSAATSWMSTCCWWPWDASSSTSSRLAC
mmetsp:Transcript_20106/g.64938  ORF Transcript_20106/g.64938 Transcript_20106/m.64938 type:complete len:267 (-) Transcript_20106:235-1035(-)